MGFLDTLFGAPARAIPPTPEQRATVGPTLTLNDPALAEFLGLSGIHTVTVTENSALGITAYYRAVSIISGTIAGLPLKTYRRRSDDSREQIPSFLDNPAGPYPLTPFAWKELVMVNLLNQGEVFLLHIYNNAGALIGLWPIHRYAVEVKWDGANKIFTVSMQDGQKKDYTSEDMTQVMGMTLDGLRGISPLSLFRQSIRLGLSAEMAAERTFTNGLLLGGIVTPDTDIEEEDAISIKNGIKNAASGPENAGDILVINRALKFSPWTMTNEDAQFLESREHQVEEFCRMFGIPNHLMSAQEKQTSWGTGVAEQNLGLQKFTLMPWTSRVEEALSTLLQNTKYVEFDYKGLLQGTPKDEVSLLIEQVKAGLLTKDEARAILNRPPLPASEQDTQEVGDQQDAEDSVQS